MNNEQRDIEDIIEECLQRLAQGETAEAILFAYPRRAAELHPLLTAAAALRGAPAPEASAAARAAALGGMVSAVESAHAAAQPRFAWLAAFRSRPSAYQGAALAGVLLLFGALGLGGAAATGNTPEPVQSFFGVSSTSVIEDDDCDRPGATPTAGTPAATATPELDDDGSDGDDREDDQGEDGEDDGGDENDADDVCATTTPRATPTAGPPGPTATPDLDDDNDDVDDGAVDDLDDGAVDDVDDGDLDDVEDGAVDDLDDLDLNDVDDGEVGD